MQGLFRFISFYEKDSRRDGGRGEWNVNGVKFLFSPILFRSRAACKSTQSVFAGQSRATIHGSRWSTV